MAYETSVDAQRDFMVAQLKLFFDTRPDLVSWATGKTPTLGTIADAGGFRFRYVGTGTVIPDMPGWKPYGKAEPGHFAQNVNPGVTDMTAATLAAAGVAPEAYRAASTITHPNITTPVRYDLTTDASDMGIQITTGGTHLEGGSVSASAGTPLAIRQAVDGVAIRDMAVSGNGRLFYANTALGDDGWLKNVVISGARFRGLTSTAITAIGFNGNTDGALVYGNYISYFQRSSQMSKYAKALGVAGNFGADSSNPSTQPANASRNVLFALNLVDQIRGAAFDTEDNNLGIGSLGNIVKNSSMGIAVTNDHSPTLQYHLANIISDWSESAFKANGTGDLNQTTIGFNLMNGENSTGTGVAAAIIGNGETDGIVYIGNHHKDLPGGGLKAKAKAGRINVAYNTWDGVTDALIEGNTTNTQGRGLRIESNNVMRNLNDTDVDLLDTAGIVLKANAANFMGDQRFRVELIANITSEELLFTAIRPGFLTNVSMSYDGQGVLSGNDANVVIYKVTGGTATAMTDNLPIKSDNTAYSVQNWDASHNNINIPVWAAGDMLIVRNTAGGAANKKGTILEIEYFEYN